MNKIDKKNHTPCEGFSGCQEYIINWSKKSSKRKQNKSKANIISLNRSEQDKKVQSAGKKAFLERDVHSTKEKAFLEN